MIYIILLFKKRDDKEIVDNQKENDFINFDDIVPNFLLEEKKLVKNYRREK